MRRGVRKARREADTLGAPGGRARKGKEALHGGRGRTGRGASARPCRHGIARSQGRQRMEHLRRAGHTALQRRNQPEVRHRRDRRRNHPQGHGNRLLCPRDSHQAHTFAHAPLGRGPARMHGQHCRAVRQPPEMRLQQRESRPAALLRDHSRRIPRPRNIHHGTDSRKDTHGNLPLGARGLGQAARRNGSRPGKGHIRRKGRQDNGQGHIQEEKGEARGRIRTRNGLYQALRSRPCGRNIESCHGTTASWQGRP